MKAISQTRVITKGIQACCLPQYSSRDQTGVGVKYNKSQSINHHGTIHLQYPPKVKLSLR